MTLGKWKMEAGVGIAFTLVNNHKVLRNMKDVVLSKGHLGLDRLFWKFMYSTIQRALFSVNNSCWRSETESFHVNVLDVLTIKI